MFLILICSWYVKFRDWTSMTLLWISMFFQVILNKNFTWNYPSTVDCSISFLVPALEIWSWWEKWLRRHDVIGMTCIYILHWKLEGGQNYWLLLHCAHCRMLIQKYCAWVDWKIWSYTPNNTGEGSPWIRRPLAIVKSGELTQKLACLIL